VLDSALAELVEQGVRPCCLRP